MFILMLLVVATWADECSDVTEISKCLTTSEYCIIIKAGTLYRDESSQVGTVQDPVNDVCRVLYTFINQTINFYSSCKYLITQQKCYIGSCIWDPKMNYCYEWGVAPCQSYHKDICQWNPICQVQQYSLKIDLNQNYTLMNDVDLIQSDGRRVGTWMYDFGIIEKVESSTNTTETYKLSRCSMMNQCHLVEGDQNCHNNVLDCYYDYNASACKPLSHLAPCNSIRVQHRCESVSAPCIWLQGNCMNLGDPLLPCAALPLSKCLLNEKCYVSGSSCLPFTSCADFITKATCDTSSYYSCYYNTLMKTCQPITQLTHCEDIGEKNCASTNRCDYVAATTNPVNAGYCKFRNLRFTCGNLVNRILCQAEVTNCQWNLNQQICIQKQEPFITCAAYTKATCDSGKTCYYNTVDNVCTPIQASTSCSDQGPISCGFDPTKSRCVYVDSYCISAYDASCDKLPVQFCVPYGQQCYYDGTCKKRRMCSDNGDQVEDCNNDTLNCYFDYTTKKCRRVTFSTECHSLYKQDACNLALCAWKNSQCLYLEEVACAQLALNRCQYSDRCNLQNNTCMPVEACSINDENKAKCDLDINHCYYSDSKCLPINGETWCKDVVGAVNCDYGSCALQPDKDNVLQCLEYADSDCAFLTQDYCRFGKCRWSSTLKTCRQYPEPVVTPIVVPPTNTTNPEVPKDDTDTSSHQNIIGIMIIINIWLV